MLRVSKDPCGTGRCAIRMIIEFLGTFILVTGRRRCAASWTTTWAPEPISRTRRGDRARRRW